MVAGGFGLVFAGERTPFILSGKQRQDPFGSCVFVVIVLSIMERSPYIRVAPGE